MKTLTIRCVFYALVLGLVVMPPFSPDLRAAGIPGGSSAEGPQSAITAQLFVRSLAAGGTLIFKGQESELQPGRAYPAEGVVLVSSFGADGMTVMLSNGVVLILGEDTRLRIERLVQRELIKSYPDRMRRELSPSETKIIVEKGSVFVSAKTLLDASRLMVITPGGSLQVRGELMIRVTESETTVTQQAQNSLVFVFSGSGVNQQSFELAAGQQVVLPNAGNSGIGATHIEVTPMAAPAAEFAFLNTKASLADAVGASVRDFGSVLADVTLIAATAGTGTGTTGDGAGAISGLSGDQMQNLDTLASLADGGDFGSLSEDTTLTVATGGIGTGTTGDNAGATSELSGDQTQNLDTLAALADAGGASGGDFDSLPTDSTLTAGAGTHAANPGTNPSNVVLPVTIDPAAAVSPAVLPSGR